jgi:beta-N-acetylhexosaminidase
MTASNARVLAKSNAGSVIFLGNSRAGAASVRRLVARVRSATPTPQKVRTMVTVDQEGGTVQRLRGPGFETIPSARRQASSSNSKLRRDAKRWGRQLKAAGIDADLAPVADVVPTSMVPVNQPIGRLDRGYGPNPKVVALKAGAFVRGMDEAGIATAVKHFPGLGRVRGNTDFVSRVVDNQTKRRSADLQGFGGAVSARVDMVMVSSAYYTKIDPTRRAAFSPTIINQMIRSDLKFGGVVISDDLSARAVQDLTPGRRALLFLQAGGDLVIVGNPKSAAAMTSAVIAEAKRSPRFAATVQTKVARVLAMKARRGLASCS